MTCLRSVRVAKNRGAASARLRWLALGNGTSFQPSPTESVHATVTPPLAAYLIRPIHARGLRSRHALGSGDLGRVTPWLQPNIEDEEVAKDEVSCVITLSYAVTLFLLNSGLLPRQWFCRHSSDRSHIPQGVIGHRLGKHFRALFGEHDGFKCTKRIPQSHHAVTSDIWKACGASA